jgi:hypothetical protein
MVTPVIQIVLASYLICIIIKYLLPKRADCLHPLEFQMEDHRTFTDVIEQRSIQFTFKRPLLLHAHYNNSRIAGLAVVSDPLHIHVTSPWNNQSGHRRARSSFRSKNNYYFAGYKLKESRLATSKMARQPRAPCFLYS